MEFRILGPVRVRSGRREDAVSGSKQRTMLAALLLAEGRTVSDDHLRHVLWGEYPPTTAAAQIHTYASRIRQRVYPAVRIERIRTGYSMPDGNFHLDYRDFRRLTERAHRVAAARDYGETAKLLRRALALWRGDALADTTEHMVSAERPHLEEQYLEALEMRIEAELALGRQQELVPELRSLVLRQPSRERLRALWMTALYRADRQVDAIAVFQDYRKTLDEELGVPPGRLLTHTYRGLLTGEACFRLPRQLAAAESPLRTL